MIEQAIARLKAWTEGILWADVDYDELIEADKPCPKCERDTLHVEEGRFTDVYRCSECRFEGAKL